MPTCQCVLENRRVAWSSTRCTVAAAPTAGSAAGSMSSRTGAPASAAARASDAPVAGTKLVLVVGVALINASCGERKVLLAQRPAGRANEGMWEFPGGKVDAGETPEAALCRELHEELRIEVAESDLQPLSFVSFPYPTFHLLMPLYGECCIRYLI
eukprot:365569-Chlamydomonas_euryale.AAC.29